MDELSATTKTLVRILRKKKILSLKDLCQAANCCHMTVWRNLKRVGYYTSYTHNDRFWTLAETPRFDNDGLWFYRDVGFSLYGTLFETAIQIVQYSIMGMTPHELSEQLRARVQNQLHDAFVQGHLHRVAWGRTQLYLSVDPEAQTKQWQQRQKHGQAHETHSLGDSDTIAVLVELVRAPRSSAHRVATILGARGIHVTVASVQTIIDTYDLRKKGRYPQSRP
jgi:hypothetical protein